MGLIGYKHTEEAKMKISHAAKFPRSRKPKDINNEFDKRYTQVTESGCWIWIGNTAVNGYGVFPIGKRGKFVAAHRFSYERYIGPIPDGLFVCHSCDVTCCVNPYHLFVGTHTDNMRDCWDKGRGKHPGGKCGESHPSSRISASAVMKIRELYCDGRSGNTEGKFSARQLAKMFNTTYATITNIASGAT